MKAVLTGKFRAMNAHIRKTVRSEINDPSFHLHKLDKEQIKSKVKGKKDRN